VLVGSAARRFYFHNHQKQLQAKMRIAPHGHGVQSLRFVFTSFAALLASTFKSSMAFLPSRLSLSGAHSTRYDAFQPARQFHLSMTALDIAQTILPSVALILPLGVRNTTARGSGFVIDFSIENRAESDASSGDDCIYLLTAAHVALPGYRIQAVFYPNNNSENEESVLLPATVIGRDIQSDLALLKVNITGSQFMSPRPLVLSNQTKATIGTPTYAVGYPSGGMVGPAMTSGIVCGNALGLVTAASVGDILDGSLRNETSSGEENGNGGKTKTKYVVTDAAMAGGMSGGPLVNGNSGDVLGLNALINMELRALGNYAVSSSECTNFLSQLTKSLGQSKTDGQPLKYQVVLYNDRFNKRARVQSLLESIAKLNSTASNQIMMDAHTKGRGIVQEFCGDDVEARKLRDAMRKEDLLVELEMAY
jgi:S1-C subfamily serine protease